MPYDAFGYYDEPAKPSGKVHRAVYSGGSTSALCASDKGDETRKHIRTTSDDDEVTCRKCLKYLGRA